MPRFLFLLFILIAGYAGIYFLGSSLAKTKPQISENYADEDLYFSSNQLNAIGGDFKGLLADWYWINSLQYMGNKLLNRKEEINLDDLRPINPKLLYPMLDAATTLDPKFTTVYSYGAMILPAVDSNQAVKLLEKGIAENPDDWQLYHNLGFIYWRLKNYPKAAEIYELGSQKPNAPNWMRLMSANMQAEGGSRDFARKIYKQIFETAEDAQTRSIAEMKYAQVQSLDELDSINRSLEIFRRKNNRCPQSWREVMPYLEKTVPPYGDALQRNEKSELLDPTGVPYVLNYQSCTADTDSAKSKIPTVKAADAKQ